MIQSIVICADGGCIPDRLTAGVGYSAIHENQASYLEDAHQQGHEDG